MSATTDRRSPQNETPCPACGVAVNRSEMSRHARTVHERDRAYWPDGLTWERCWFLTQVLYALQRGGEIRDPNSMPVLKERLAGLGVVGYSDNTLRSALETLAKMKLAKVRRPAGAKRTHGILCTAREMPPTDPFADQGQLAPWAPTALRDLAAPSEPAAIEAVEEAEDVVLDLPDELDDWRPTMPPTGNDREAKTLAILQLAGELIALGPPEPRVVEVPAPIDQDAAAKLAEAISYGQKWRRRAVEAEETARAHKKRGDALHEANRVLQANCDALRGKALSDQAHNGMARMVSEAPRTGARA